MRKYLDLTPEAAIATANLTEVIDGRPFGIDGFVGQSEGSTMSFLVESGTVISVQRNGIVVEYNSTARTDIEEYPLEGSAE